MKFPAFMIEENSMVKMDDGVIGILVNPHKRNTLTVMVRSNYGYQITKDTELYIIQTPKDLALHELFLRVRETKFDPIMTKVRALFRACKISTDGGIDIWNSGLTTCSLKEMLDAGLLSYSPGDPDYYITEKGKILVSIIEDSIKPEGEFSP